jgi:hypothetical protein
MFVPAASPIMLVLFAALLPSSVSGADHPVLTATVGTNDSFVISLTDANGGRVSHLEAGTYTIVVHDRSPEHDFHLAGVGVSAATAVEEVSDPIWTVAFVDGIYTYVCDPHAGIMKGRFAVGSAQLSPTTASLDGRVGPGRILSLRHPDGSKVTVLNGVTSIRAIVTDRSRTDNFHLTGPGVDKTTGVGFRGRVTWTVKVSPGVYRYRSDRHKALRGSFSVIDAAYRGG